MFIKPEIQTFWNFHAFMLEVPSPNFTSTYTYCNTGVGPMLYTQGPLVLNASVVHMGGRAVGGAFPYVDGYQVPVNRSPFFYADLTPNDPLSHSVHTQ